MADIGTLNPEQMLQQQQILRQQRMAEMLMQRPAPQGQMIGNRFVAPSFTQNLANLANLYVGKQGVEKAEQAQIDLARQLRADETSAMTDFMQQRQGRPAIPEQVTEMAGPYGQSGDGANIPMPTATMAGQPAIQANPQAAYANLMANPKASSRLQNMAFNKLIAEPEAFTLAEGAKRFMTMPDGNVKEVAAGGEKPRSPVSVGNYLIDPVTGKVIFQAPEKPTAGHILETDTGPMLIDTRTGQARPIMAGGQALVGGKPLTESQGNATAFGMRMKESNQLINDLEAKGVSNTGIVRSTIGGIAGMTPFIGDKLQQGVQSSMNVLPGVLGGPSSEQQQVDAARKNFVTAVLRKESGAAISPTEFYTEAQKYFPQPGDSSAVIKQKSHARETAIKAMEMQAGPGKRQIEQITNQAQSVGTGGVVDFNSLPKGR